MDELNHLNDLRHLLNLSLFPLQAAGPENQKKRYWTQHILATSSIYYFTDTIMPSMLCYYENVRHEHFADFAMELNNRITVPFGYTSFYWDTEPSSKRAVERTGNLVFYKGVYHSYQARSCAR